MNNFWDGFSNKSMLRDIVMQSYPAEYLLGLAMGNDGDFVKDVAESYSYLVAEAVRKLEAMSVDAYLALVRDHYGDEVLGDILAALNEDLLFAQKFVLNEHHLYGSSRLGVKTHKRVLLRKEFSISGFEETGEIIVDEVTDSLVYVASSEYFYRVLAQKQYEMSNHLGNVLATVLDRKTGVFDEMEDTLMYYTADVVNATLYYPFGQAMLSYKNVEFAFAYGLNGQEKDDEIFEGAYSAEYWQYDSRLGRRWNNDPKPNPSVSVYACFGNNPIWFTDVAGDSNIVYLHVLSSAFTEEGGSHTWEDIDNYVTQTNEYYKKMGINLRMEIFSRDVDATKNALFDINKMDNTDVVIAFGHHTEVKDWSSVYAPQQEFPDFDKDALAESAINYKSKMVPISDNPQNRVVLMNSKALKFYSESKELGLGGKYSVKETFGFTVLHELGHISTISHGTTKAEIMKEWKFISTNIREGRYDINYYLSKNDEINGFYLKEMRERFYSSQPSRNY